MKRVIREEEVAILVRENQPKKEKGEWGLVPHYISAVYKGVVSHSSGDKGDLLRVEIIREYFNNDTGYYLSKSTEAFYETDVFALNDIPSKSKIIEKALFIEQCDRYMTEAEFNNLSEAKIKAFHTKNK